MFGCLYMVAKRLLRGSACGAAPGSGFLSGQGGLLPGLPDDGNGAENEQREEPDGLADRCQSTVAGSDHALQADDGQQGGAQQEPQS